MSPTDAVETVEAITDATDHISYARRVGERSGLKGKRLALLDRRIEAIERRLNDPNLYLAVIGEFSAGKSTFINALLRDPLLSWSSVMTTTVATAIHHGPDLEVEVQLKDDPGWAPLPPSTRVLRQRLVGHLPPDARPSDLRGWLNLLTTDATAATVVTRVRARHPAELLADGVVVIDTPGTEALEEHTETARRVITEQADTVVVVIASDRPLSDPLAAFLKQNLGPLVLQRCLFVLTKMDRIDEDERERLLRGVERRLEGKLGRKDPVVLPAELRIAGDGLDGRRSRIPEQDGWGRGFPELEARLREHMRQQRAIMVSNSVLRLLDELLSGLHSELSNRQRELEQRRGELSSARIRDLDAFMDELVTEMEATLGKQIKRSRSALGKALERRQEALAAAVEQQLAAAVNNDTLNAAVKHKIPTALQEILEGLERDINAVAETFYSQARRLADQVRHRFDQEYTKLAVLGAPPERLPHLERRKLDSHRLVFTAATSVADQAVRKENFRLGTGAAAGAALGTAVVPIVGTAVGAVLGGMVGWLFAPGVDEVRAQLRQTLSAELGASYEAISSSVGDGFDTLVRQYARGLDMLLDDYHDRYQQAVDKLVAGQQREADKLRRMEAMTDKDAREILRRRDLLQTQRQRLSEAAAP